MSLPCVSEWSQPQRVAGLCFLLVRPRASYGRSEALGCLLDRQKKFGIGSRVLVRQLGGLGQRYVSLNAFQPWHPEGLQRVCVRSSVALHLNLPEQSRQYGVVSESGLNTT